MSSTSQAYLAIHLHPVEYGAFLPILLVKYAQGQIFSPENEALAGDGSGGGKMTIDKLSEILRAIESSSYISGLTIAEYLPFEEFRFHKMLQGLRLFSD